MKKKASASWLEDSCAVWLASEQYIAEAVQSAESVRRHMPDVPRVLLCDTPPGHHEVFDIEIHGEHSGSPDWFLRSTEMLVYFYTLSDFRTFLYFDTDTYMLEPIYDALEVAQRFDITGTHAPGRKTGKPYFDIPDAFPEINTGVTIYHYTPATTAVMCKWRDLYREHPEIYHRNEQVPLRDAMWSESNNGFRLYILPQEYNCRFGFGGFARYHVKVLHGRSDDYERLGQQINAVEDMRGWTRGTFK